MTKLLYIEASPRKQRSHSIAAAKAFLDAYREANPTDKIETWDLFDIMLPAIDGDILTARYQLQSGKEVSADAADAWAKIVDWCDRFKSADKYLISTPMWNFGVPYVLKHLIDVIIQPGQTFNMVDGNYVGLVTGKPVVVIHARAGQYTESDAMRAMDFEKPYLTRVLGFMGFETIEHITIEPTVGDSQTVAKADAAAAQKAHQSGQSI